MNENDEPAPRTFEARLAAMAPKIALAQQRELLFACAFAAGREQARVSTRRWRAATWVFGLALMAALIPVADGVIRGSQGGRTPSLATNHERATDASASRPDAEAGLDSRGLVGSARPTPSIELDAWKLAQSDANSLSKELAQWKHSDPRDRSVSVIELSRAMEAR